MLTIVIECHGLYRELEFAALAEINQRLQEDNTG
jgi:hypothetical protein